MNTKVKNTVLVVGASDKPDRYSTRAIKMLQDAKHTIIGIHPSLRVAEGTDVYPSLDQIPEALSNTIDTVTMYVNTQVSDNMIESLKRLSPRRIIWNPGSENLSVIDRLKETSIQNIEACTLVLLSTDQF